ncbi:hypothetical protein M9H77_04546 [Catharanthus roseus]|uniref:Uncharacterized protein n=1 Tax=Catharanthus roseus TaxID=4058 RepID=A0ACC0CEB5_CATRO|nr:hypothetical protein M9H77_04546 [Catharanthus roseus]
MKDIKKLQDLQDGNWNNGMHKIRKVNIKHEDEFLGLKMKQEFIQQHFNSYEASEILKVPLCDDWPRDEQIWAYNPTGRFTVCSSYKLVHQAKINVEDEECSSESAMEKFWTCLWGLSIAPKIKIPLWKKPRLLLGFTSGTLVNGVVRTPTSLQKGKVVIEEPQEDIRQIITHVHLNRRTNVTIPEGCHWRPPDLGYFKHNVDASWTTSKAGFGVLFEVTKAECVLHSQAPLQASSPEHAETIAVCEGLKLAERFGYSCFTIEIDCKGVINQLQSHSGALSPLEHKRRQIFTFIDRLQVLLSFARRNANVLVYLLTAKAISNYPSNIWMEVVPHVIAAAVQTGCLLI